jgi:hypothetical protein
MPAVSRTASILTHAKRLPTGALSACIAMAAVGKCVRITFSKLDFSYVSNLGSDADRVWHIGHTEIARSSGYGA